MWTLRAWAVGLGGKAWCGHTIRYNKRHRSQICRDDQKPEYKDSDPPCQGMFSVFYLLQGDMFIKIETSVQISAFISLTKFYKTNIKES